jgi:hypothetical protein
MAYEVKDMTGSLFPNKDKKTDNHPDRNGSAKIEGVEYWVSGWVKQDKNGQPWLSMAFKRKDQPAKTLPAAQTDGARVAPRRRDDDDMGGDSIPF